MANDEPARLIIQDTCIVCKKIQHFETPEDVTGYPVGDGDWVCSLECLEQYKAAKKMTKDKETIDSIRGIIKDTENALNDSWNKTDKVQLLILGNFLQAIKRAVKTEDK